MQCSQCATALSDATTTCSNCGQSTRPFQAATFSYLPAGTPSWPGNIPQQIPYSVNAAINAHAPSHTLIATETRHSPARMLAVIAILVLTPLLGILLTLGILHQNGQIQQSSPVPARHTNSSNAQKVMQGNQVQGNQVATSTAFKTAKDTRLNMTLQYPSDWTAGSLVQSGDSIYLALQAPQQQIAFFVQRYSDSASASISGSSALNNGSIQGLTQVQGVNNIQNATLTNKQPTIGGTQWDQQDALFSNANNVQMHFMTISVQHNHDYYNIVSIAPQATYQDTLQQYIQPMLNSAQFLS